MVGLIISAEKCPLLNEDIIVAVNFSEMKLRKKQRIDLNITYILYVDPELVTASNCWDKRDHTRIVQTVRQISVSVLN